MTAGQRVTSAREDLEAVIREQLARVVANALQSGVPSAGMFNRATEEIRTAAGAGLAPAEVAIVSEALAVAAEYRRYRAGLACQACAEHPAELCEDHQADLDAADEYEALAARIGAGSGLCAGPACPLAEHIGAHTPGVTWHGAGEVLTCIMPDESAEPEPDDYDPGPEVDDEGGMSEYRHAGLSGEEWLAEERAGSGDVDGER